MKKKFFFNNYIICQCLKPKNEKQTKNSTKICLSKKFKIITHLFNKGDLITINL